MSKETDFAKKCPKFKKCRDRVWNMSAPLCKDKKCFLVGCGSLTRAYKKARSKKWKS